MPAKGRAAMIVLALLLAMFTVLAPLALQTRVKGTVVLPVGTFALSNQRDRRVYFMVSGSKGYRLTGAWRATNHTMVGVAAPGQPFPPFHCKPNGGECPPFSAFPANGSLDIPIMGGTRGVSGGPVCYYPGHPLGDTPATLFLYFLAPAPEAITVAHSFILHEVPFDGPCPGS